MRMMPKHNANIDFNSFKVNFSSSQAREAVVLEHGEIPAAGNPVACPQVRPHKQKVDLAPGPALTPTPCDLLAPSSWGHLDQLLL